MVSYFVAPTEPDCEGNCWVVVAPTDMTANVHHDHLPRCKTFNLPPITAGVNHSMSRGPMAKLGEYIAQLKQATGL